MVAEWAVNSASVMGSLTVDARVYPMVGLMDDGKVVWTAYVRDGMKAGMWETWAAKWAEPWGAPSGC